MFFLIPSLFQPQRLSPELVCAIECIHSEDPLSLEDKALILAHREELRDHITAEARVVLDSVVSESNHRSPTVRGHRRGEPEDDVTSAACTILDFMERNGGQRPPTDRNRLLPRPVILAAAETSRLRVVNELERNGKASKKKNN